jgi:hypothetical protein
MWPITQRLRTVPHEAPQLKQANKKKELELAIVRQISSKLFKDVRYEHYTLFSAVRTRAVLSLMHQEHTLQFTTWESIGFISYLSHL